MIYTEQDMHYSRTKAQAEYARKDLAHEAVAFGYPDGGKYEAVHHFEFYAKAPNTVIHFIEDENGRQSFFERDDGTMGRIGTLDKVKNTYTRHADFFTP